MGLVGMRTDTKERLWIERVLGEISGTRGYWGGGQGRNLVQWKFPQIYEGDPREDS